MKKLLVLIPILFYSLLCSAQKYEYPILPGTPEWQKLEGYQDMLKACQIPEDKLKSMNTDELLQTCLDFPISISFYAFDNMYEGVDNLTPNFNGLRELLDRKDNVLSLYRLLIKVNIDDLISNKYLSKREKGKQITRIALIETFLTLPEILHNMTNDQAEIIIDKVYDNLVKKEMNKEYFSKYSLESSALLLGEGLNKVTETSSITRDYKSILRSGKILNQETLIYLKKHYKSIRFN